MRRVAYQERVWIKTPENARGYWEILKGEAAFHAFGIDHEELDGGPGNYSTAIIELPDGEVRAVRATDIKFIEQPSDE